MTGNEGRAAPADAVVSGDLRQQVGALLPEMRGFARFLARDRTAADDLVQDTIVKAINALDQFQPGTNLKAWLFTILRNHFYEQSRRARREIAVMAEFVEGDEAVMGAQQARSEISDLQVLIFRLPPLLREALILVGAQGLSHDEAAAICDVPVGTMKARLSRARSQLASMTG